MSDPMDDGDNGQERGGRGFRGRGRGRGRFEGRGRGGPRRPDPQPCPISVDEEGKLKIKASVLIVREYAGAVIGRGGEHVAEVRKETGALVHVCKADFQTGVQGVDIYGRLNEVALAQQKISQVLRDNAPEWCEDKNFGARIKLSLLPDIASVVIGKKGVNVQRISKDSGAVVRVSNETDSYNLQSCQIFGNNDETTVAFGLVIQSVEAYDAANSRTIPRLRDAWEERRRAEAFPPPDVGAGGPSRSYGSGDRSYGDRYEPYPRSNGRGRDLRYGGSSSYSSRASPNGRMDVQSQIPVVTVPGGVSVPGIQGAMPTVLIQQADGSLVQAQVVTQQGQQYSVQPATALQGAVAGMKATYGIQQPMAISSAPTGTLVTGAASAQPQAMMGSTVATTQAQGQRVVYQDPNMQQSVMAAQGAVQYATMPQQSTQVAYATGTTAGGSAGTAQGHTAMQGGHTTDQVAYGGLLQYGSTATAGAAQQGKASSLVPTSQGSYLTSPQATAQGAGQSMSMQQGAQTYATQGMQQTGQMQQGAVAYGAAGTQQAAYVQQAYTQQATYAKK